MSSQWWYCLKHSTVEGDEGCANADRMGPYASREEAERAIQSAATRTHEWDHDPRWNDDEER